ncbi:flagellin-like hook-associated protein FlgL [Catenulispora sp. GP43]|uniref:flagellin n=1 Tax=Catenulispora sp. GP43 TaxID=3156263 RepID=UPI00351884C4
MSETTPAGDETQPVASQRRTQSTISVLQNVTQNVTAAQGRVQDADLAAEPAELTDGEATG